MIIHICQSLIIILAPVYIREEKSYYYGCGVKHSLGLKKSVISLPLTKAVEDGVIQQRTDQDRTGLTDAGM